MASSILERGDGALGKDASFTMRQRAVAQTDSVPWWKYRTLIVSDHDTAEIQDWLDGTGALIERVPWKVMSALEDEPGLLIADVHRPALYLLLDATPFDWQEPTLGTEMVSPFELVSRAIGREAK